MNDGGLSLSLFSREEQVQIDLLQTLNRLGAPMKAYEEVMRWATRSVQQGHNFCDAQLTSRKTLVSKLSARLSRVALEPIRADLYLPYSNVTISIVYFNASAVFTDLLSCPQLNRDENYIFHGDFNPDHSPFAIPSRNVIGDINTGRSYHYTHRKLCQNPNDMLLPCVLAIDKTTCDISGSGRLPMEPITIQYGLMKHDVRKKPFAMRVLGYINCSTTHSRSNSNPNRATPLPRSQEVSDAALRLNEYHMQVKFILERSGFLALQEHGFKWNLKYHGKSFQTVLHPYVPFIIGDTEGHDTLCGHYRSRTSGVSQLCRVCECPTEKSGWSKGRYFTRRTPAAVNDLVHRGNLEGLKLKSQHYLSNAFDTVRFGQHDKRGIFGACPGEILHLVLIGWFKYVVESFFAQAGKNSIAVQKYVTLCHDIGLQLDRQSDRNVPRTSFRDFSTASNIPGNEYAGCLFIMLISMHTSRYTEIFARSRLAKCQKAADKHLGNPNFMEDWKDLLTSLLEWLAWLKQPQITRVSAQRSVFATAHLMRLVKFVAPRFKGMSNNTIKMHLVLHIHEDIINFGVPEVMNSAYAESSHRPIAKFTVRNTQKRHKSFTFQAANRYVENLSIDQGSQVVSDDRKKNTLTATGVARAWTGKEFTITLDDNKVPICEWRLDKKKKSQVPSVRPIPEDHVLSMIANHCHPHVFPPVIHCQTEFITDEGQIYRAHPSYQDAPWYDHVLLDWSECDDPLPARICTFINLFNIKANASICFPESGQETVPCPPGLYAVVESYDPIPPFTSDADDESFDAEDDTPPDLFQHYTKTLLSDNISPKLYLVNVKAIVGPTVVVRDVVGHPSDVSVSDRRSQDTYIFMAVRRKEWASRWEHKVDLAYQEKNEDGAESTEDEDDSATIKDRRMYKRMHGTA
ncbi:hypothetical protein MHU86_13777 [Fragilaria crotonensis]|nr:hypothetical protein MHU86_13777 [Fragilaria crotonensis]